MSDRDRLSLVVLSNDTPTDVEESGPRLTIVLHPNTSRIDIALSDRLFNTEKYSFSRKIEATSKEKELLDYLETYIVGITKASATKNTLQLELAEGVYIREFMPQVITAVKSWGSGVEPYDPAIYVENRRWEREPKYDDIGWTRVEGVRQPAGQVNIGVPYKTWVAGE